MSPKGTFVSGAAVTVSSGSALPHVAIVLAGPAASGDFGALADRARTPARSIPFAAVSLAAGLCCGIGAALASASFRPRAGSRDRRRGAAT